MNKRPKMRARDALGLVPDDMPDGAAMAMAADIGGFEDYGDFVDALVEDYEEKYGADEAELIQAPPKEARCCPICGRKAKSAKAVSDHLRDKHQMTMVLTPLEAEQP